MAIAISASGSNFTGSVNLGTGSNRVAFVVAENTAATVPPTIAGVAMTAAMADFQSFSTPNQYRANIYYYINPPTGSQTIVNANSSTGHYLILSGCLQTASVIDANNVNAQQSTSTVTATVNTATANCWTIGCFDYTGGTFSSVGGTFTANIGGGLGLAYSNGTVATGSINGSFTYSGGFQGFMAMIKVAPAAAAVTVTPDIRSYFYA